MPDRSKKTFDRTLRQQADRAGARRSLRLHLHRHQAANPISLIDRGVGRQASRCRSELLTEIDAETTCNQACCCGVFWSRWWRCAFACHRARCRYLAASCLRIVTEPTTLGRWRALNRNRCASRGSTQEKPTLRSGGRDGSLELRLKCGEVRSAKVAIEGAGA